MQEKYLKSVRKVIQCAETTDPFEICSRLGIKVIRAPLGSLKGFTTTNYRIRTIFINEEFIQTLI